MQRCMRTKTHKNICYRDWSLRHWFLSLALLSTAAYAIRGEEPRDGVGLRPIQQGRRLVDLYGDPLPVGAVARMGTLRFWAASPIDNMTFAPDGKILATASHGSCIIWESRTGRVVRTLRVPERLLPDDFDVFEGVVFSQDGKILAAWGRSAIALWEVPTGRMTRLIHGEYGRIHHLAFASDGNTLVAAAEESAVAWNLTTGREIRRLAGKSIVTFALSRDGRMLATGYPDGTIRIWDVTTGEATVQIPPLLSLRAICFSPDCAVITSLHSDGTLRSWDWAKAKEVQRIRLDDWSPQPVLVLSSVGSDGKRMIATSSWDGSARIWEAETGKRIRRIQLEPGKVALVEALSVDAGLIAVAGGGDNDRTLQLWDFATGKEKCAYARHEGAIISMAFSPDDTTIATAGGDSTLRLWDVASGREVRRIRVDAPVDLPKAKLKAFLRPEAEPLSAVTYAPDGKSIVSAGPDGMLRFWDTTTGNMVRRVHLEQSGQADRFAFSPDGRALVASKDGNGTLALWSVATGRSISQIEAHHGVAIYAVAFSRDAKCVASARRLVKVWNTPELNLRDQFDPMMDVEDVALSPDGTMVCFAQADGVLTLWKLKNRQVLHSPPAPAPQDGDDDVLQSVAFSATGTRVAWCGPDRVVRIWDVSAWKEMGRYSGHQALVSRVLFSNRSRLVSSASYDGTILVWDESALPQ